MKAFCILFIWACVYLCLSLTGCGRGQKPGKKNIPVIAAEDSTLIEWKQTMPGNFSQQTELFLDSTFLTQFFIQYPRFTTFKLNLQKFYRNRHFTYAWFDQSGLIEQAGNIANKFLNLQQEGIGQELPYRQELDSLLAEINQEGGSKPDPRTELMLTAGYFAFARTAWEGLNDSITQSLKWYVPRKKIHYGQLLDSLLKQPPQAVKEPVYHQYELLRTYLRRYQQLDKTGSWLQIKSTRKGYKLGDQSQVIARIKRRLRDLGDLAADTISPVFGPVLQAAVKQFQRRHGLSSDGAIGPVTLAELNVPLENRILQILVNMERTRWLPVHFEPAYLVVNIPEYKLHVYQSDSLAWSCRVVVGKAVHKTVIFSGQIKYVVFSPYWYVPASIVRNEVLPGMRRDRRYLARHNMQVIGRSKGLPLVRQKPGPHNALGKVKFLFPNSYHIYLHDTPAKSLFGETSRAFSHGCIRVSEPAKLAAFVLRDSPEWNKGKIQAAMQAGTEHSVTLQQPVPVYIVYFTTFIDQQGKINFRKDIYNRDKRLAGMLIADVGA